MNPPSKKISLAFVSIIFAYFVMGCIFIGFSFFVAWAYKDIRDWQPVYKARTEDCRRQCRSYTYGPLLVYSEYRQDPEGNGEYCVCTLRKQ